MVPVLSVVPVVLVRRYLANETKMIKLLREFGATGETSVVMLDEIEESELAAAAAAAAGAGAGAGGQKRGKGAFGEEMAFMREDVGQHDDGEGEGGGRRAGAGRRPPRQNHLSVSENDELALGAEPARPKVRGSAYTYIQTDRTQRFSVRFACWIMGAPKSQYAFHPKALNNNRVSYLPMQVAPV